MNNIKMERDSLKYLKLQNNNASKEDEGFNFQNNKVLIYNNTSGANKKKMFLLLDQKIHLVMKKKIIK